MRTPRIAYLDYVSELDHALRAATGKDLVEELVEDVWSMKHRWVITMGNGGSSAIASHFAVDLMKTVRTRPQPTVCLTDMTPALTAFANDDRWDTAWVNMLGHLGAFEGDIAIIISSSGKSANAFRAAEWCWQRKIKLYCLTGFGGGALLHGFPHRTFHVPSDDYGIVEDSHHAFMHMVTRALNKRKE